MQRARMISIPLPKGTKSNLRRRDWGIERSYTTSKGNEICTPAPYEKLTMTNRKFKITTTDLIDLGYVGWEISIFSFKIVPTRKLIYLCYLLNINSYLWLTDLRVFDNAYLIKST